MKKQKQKGIVLLSCLVFLLILTSLVKYTMSSAKMEELKAGADFDEMSAKEAALLAIKDAEDFILRRHYDKDGNKLCLYTNNEPADKSDLDCTKTTVKKDGEYATTFWKNKTNWENLPGIYSGDDVDSRCNDETCLKQAAVNDEWYKATNCKDNNAVICYGQFTRVAESREGILDQEKAKYIIEVFLPTGSVFNSTLAADIDGDNTMVVRVTAVGFSQSINSNDNFRKGAVPNDTYAMYQATYILSSD